MRRQPRGFSLITTLVVTFALTLTACFVYMLSRGARASAGARSAHTQALAAAEAGLSHFFGAPPAAVDIGTYYLGSVGTTPANFIYLPDTRGPDGTTLQSRYRVRTTTAGPVAGSVLLLSEGEVLSDNAVIGRTQVSALVVPGQQGGGNNVYGGQKSLGAWGTSSNMAARSDLNLTSFP